MLIWSCSETEVLPSGQEPNVLPDEWYRETEEQLEKSKTAKTALYHLHIQGFCLGLKKTNNKPKQHKETQKAPTKTKTNQKATNK